MSFDAIAIRRQLNEAERHGRKTTMRERTKLRTENARLRVLLARFVQMHKEGCVTADEFFSLVIDTETFLGTAAKPKENADE